MIWRWEFFWKCNFLSPWNSSEFSTLFRVVKTTNGKRLLIKNAFSWRSLNSIFYPLRKRRLVFSRIFYAYVFKINSWRSQTTRTHLTPNVNKKRQFCENFLWKCVYLFGKISKEFFSVNFHLTRFSIWRYFWFDKILKSWINEKTSSTDKNGAIIRCIIAN